MNLLVELAVNFFCPLVVFFCSRIARMRALWVMGTCPVA